LKHLLKSIDQRDDVVALEADVALGAERERERESGSQGADGNCLRTDTFSVRRTRRATLMPVTLSFA